MIIYEKSYIFMCFGCLNFDFFVFGPVFLVSGLVSGCLDLYLDVGPIDPVGPNGSRWAQMGPMHLNWCNGPSGPRAGTGARTRTRTGTGTRTRTGPGPGRYRDRDQAGTGPGPGQDQDGRAHGI